MQYEIKLKSEEEFEFIHERTCIYIHSRENECNLSTRTLKIITLIIKKSLFI